MTAESGRLAFCPVVSSQIDGSCLAVVIFMRLRYRHKVTTFLERASGPRPSYLRKQYLRASLTLRAIRRKWLHYLHNCTAPPERGRLARGLRIYAYSLGAPPFRYVLLSVGGFVAVTM
jgi:hypothetical protein